MSLRCLDTCPGPVGTCSVTSSSVFCSVGSAVRRQVISTSTVGINVLIPALASHPATDSSCVDFYDGSPIKSGFLLCLNGYRRVCQALFRIFHLIDRSCVLTRWTWLPLSGQRVQSSMTTLLPEYSALAAIPGYKCYAGWLSSSLDFGRAYKHRGPPRS